MKIKENMIVDWRGDKLKVFKIYSLSNIVWLIGKKGSIEISKDRFKKHIEEGIIKVIK